LYLKKKKKTDENNVFVPTAAPSQHTNLNRRQYARTVQFSSIKKESPELFKKSAKIK
jgi:hypothetical protein